MTNIVKLPTRAVGQHYTVRVSGRGWAVDLVTPVEGARSLRTTIARFASRIDAIAHGKATAAMMQRPFKIGRAAQ